MDVFANLGLCKNNNPPVFFPRFEEPNAGGGGERCLTGQSVNTTFVTIRCTNESSGACDTWEIWFVDPTRIMGGDPVTGDPARACVYRVFDDELEPSVYVDDYTLGPFVITATVK